MVHPPDYRAELSRKVLHVSSSLIAIVYLFAPRWFMLAALAGLLALAITVEVLRFRSRRFALLFRRSVGFMVRRHEWRRVTGATYVLLGALLCVWLFPRNVAIAALLILSISDTAASLVGLRFGRTQFLGKSLSGSLAFFLTALAILWIALPDARGLAFAAAMIATLAEALPHFRLGRLELNDNLTIPLITGGAIVLLQALVTR